MWVHVCLCCFCLFSRVPLCVSRSVVLSFPAVSHVFYLQRQAWSRESGSPDWPPGGEVCSLQMCTCLRPPSAVNRVNDCNPVTSLMNTCTGVCTGVCMCVSYLRDESAGHLEQVFSDSQVKGGVSTLLFRCVNFGSALHQQTEAALAIPPHSQVQRMKT